ncbi:MAG: T9SS type A sorting domain-containing protein, partial [Bacteroidales bacterium]|nr:T9SS type A sorting domain-containing protein [Bacteroidales bacterium]
DSGNRISYVEIYDASGRLMLTKKNITGCIDVNELKPGQYSIKLYSEDGVSQSKFVKM